MTTLPNLQRFFSKFPVIDIGDYILRDLGQIDRDAYFEMMSDPEVTKFLSDEDIPTSVDHALDEIRFWGGLFYRKQSIFWAIAEKASNNFIGTIGYNNWNYSNRRGEISYDLMRSHWRKGIMTVALRAAVKFGFEEMKLYRIEARTMVDNTASQGLLYKTNFHKEGIQRGYRIIRDLPVDIALYSITEPDYLAEK